MASDPTSAWLAGAPRTRGICDEGFSDRCRCDGRLLLPGSSIAQEAATNIVVTHVALSNSARPRARVPLAILPAERSMTGSSSTVTTSSGVAALGIVKSHAVGREWEGGSFHLVAMRGRSESAKTAAQSFDYQRFAMMAIGADVSQDISNRDTLTLAGTYAAERRRPAFIVGPQRYFRTDERAAALHWTRDDRLDLAGTLFDTGPAKPRTAAERFADLAGGAPRAVRGWGLTASLYPTREPGRLSVGIDFRDQQDRDVQHRDARVQIFLRQKF